MTPPSPNRWSRGNFRLTAIPPNRQRLSAVAVAPHVIFIFLNFWRRLCHPFGPNVTTLRNHESPGKIFPKASARESNPLSSFAREQIFSGAAQVTCVIFIPVFSVA
jgi:hypothetical protein